jgi:hypothetical protein
MINTQFVKLGLATAGIVALAAVPTARAQIYLQEVYNGAPAQVITNGPQADRGDRVGWSPRQNVIESMHYDRLLETSLPFRHSRERKECGPVTDPQLRQDCFASFQQYEPFRYAGRLHRIAAGTPTATLE